MENNSKYTTHHEIMFRVGQYIKNKQINESDFVEWCFKVESEILGKEQWAWEFQQFEMTVKNKRIFLPCNIYRILDIYTHPHHEGSRINATQIGTFATVNLPEDSKVYMDYLGIPIDLETAEPLILKGHEMACEAWCVFMMHYSDILNDKLSIDAKNRITATKDNEILAAQSYSSRQRTRNDLNKRMAIQYNMIPKPAMIRLMGNR